MCEEIDVILERIRRKSQELYESDKVKKLTPLFYVLLAFEELHLQVEQELDQVLLGTCLVGEVDKSGVEFVLSDGVSVEIKGDN